MNGLGLVLLLGVVVGAVVVRRKIRDPQSTLGHWYKEKIKPREKEITTWFFVATMLIWAVIYVAASKEDHDNSDRALKVFKETIYPQKKPGTEKQ
ncbi:MAG: hypothetical protein V3R37_11295 [Rhodospirillales bacterium]